MGKKIILNEATFKRLIKKVLNEGIYKDQWEDETKIIGSRTTEFTLVEKPTVDGRSTAS